MQPKYHSFDTHHTPHAYDNYCSSIADQYTTLIHDAVGITTYVVFITENTLCVCMEVNCMEFVDPTVKMFLSYQVTLTVVIVVVANCIQA